MTSQVLACYIIGGLLAIIGIGCGIIGSFTATEWWMIGIGAAFAVVGVLVQYGIVNPPISKKDE